MVLPKRWIVERTSAGQGLGVLEPQRLGLPVLGVHPHHAPKALQENKMISDGLLGSGHGENSMRGARMGAHNENAMNSSSCDLARVPHTTSL